MNRFRRALLGAIAAALLKPLAALAAWNKEAFGAHSAAEALKGIGAANAVPSKEILNGKTVVDSQIGQGVSRDPVFSFRIKGGARSEKVEIAGQENMGETGSIEAAVA